MFSMIVVSCTPAESEASSPSNTSPQMESGVASPSTSPLPPGEFTSTVRGKWSLWTNGTQLRGANIYQRRVYPGFDGTEFLGPGPFGPPYTQADFDTLAALGANVVNISGPGLYTIDPPYVVDEEAVANLDRLLEMAAQADLFAIITLRTGPGRSEFAIIGGGDWLPDGYIIETLWSDKAARTAWAEMWRYTAERYRGNPYVVGYDLMCEPNSNASLDVWDPETFYTDYGGTGYDWNSWYPDLVQAIRKTDLDTPILVGGNSYSDVTWLPYLKSVEAPYLVFTIHQYSPHEYTHQEQPDPTHSYPGTFDVNYDNEPETFDHAWLVDLLGIATDYQAGANIPIAVNEYGVERWVAGGSDYVRDEMDLFEQNGWNYATWLWPASWPPLAEGDNSFNFLYGPKPSNLTQTPNTLLDTYTEAWSRNAIRPSNFIP